MSRGGPLRRRRRARSGGSLAGDPLELFLDAITNALGAIMFILLMVLLFGRDEPGPEPADPSAEIARLRSEVDAARARLEADRPRGDPALRARHDAAMERFLRSQQEVSELKSRLADAEARQAAAAMRGRQVQAQVTALESTAPVPLGEGQGGTGFVRVGLLEQDARKPVHLLLDADRISRKDGLTEASVLAPPGAAAGTPVRDGAVRAELERLLAGASPARDRVELFVWTGSFRAAKLVERSLRDLGYDWNTYLLQPGESATFGESGAQK